LQVVPAASNIIWRIRDGVICVAGTNYHGELGVNKNFCDKPKMVLFAPVAKIIRKASIADLLFYSCGDGGYARYCYAQALKRIEQAVTALEIANLLQEFNSTAWRNRREINAILPAYHLVLQYVNNNADQQNTWAVISTWSRLLVMYRDFAHVRTGDPQKLRDFMEMLTQVSFPQNSVTLFQPPLAARKANRELLADLQAEPAALRIAARFLVAELPPCPPIELKRKAEDQLDEEHETKKLKK
jgi:hypothetical protein